MKQVTDETLGTLTDYLEPGINQEFLLDINLILVHARTILADIITIKNETSNFLHACMINFFYLSLRQNVVRLMN